MDNIIIVEIESNIEIYLFVKICYCFIGFVSRNFIVFVFVLVLIKLVVIIMIKSGNNKLILFLINVFRKVGVLGVFGLMLLFK